MAHCVVSTQSVLPVHEGGEGGREGGIDGRERERERDAFLDKPISLLAD